jgi:precorrin-3B methylase
VKPAGRALATFAVGFLALDAVLLVFAGVATGRRLPLVAAAACAVAAALVVIAWRRYCRVLAELQEARRAMRAEVESIRDLLQSHDLHN